MSFQLNNLYTARIDYSPNATETVKLPNGNIYSAMDLLTKLKVNVLTSTSSNAPDFQVMNAIDTFEIIQDRKNILWSLTGAELALLFTYDRRFGGKAAANNAAIAGTVANNVAGQHFLHCPFYPLDAIKAAEFGLDTRFHEYEIRVKWKDLTAAGTLFGTIGTSITTTNTDNYIEVQMHKLKLQPNPIDGTPDSLTNKAPLVVGYNGEIQTISQNNSKFDIDIPNLSSNRNVFLWATEMVNTDQEQGVATVLNNNVQVRDSQNGVYHDVLATMLHERTSQVWGLGSSINAGFYDVPLTEFGNAVDVLVDDKITDLRLRLDVTALSNDTFIHTIYCTQETQ